MKEKRQNLGQALETINGDLTYKTDLTAGEVIVEVKKLEQKQGFNLPIFLSENEITQQILNLFKIARLRFSEQFRR